MLRNTKFFAAAVMALLFSNAAHAASLGLTPGYPDLVTFNASYDYTYVDKGKASNQGGTLTVDGSLLALNPDGTGNIGVSGGDYSLIANFGVNGIFIDGSISATGTTAHPDFQSGTIVTGDLLDFGFSGIDGAGSIEFTFDNIGGDYTATGEPLGGIIISMTDMMDGFAPYSGSWDPASDNNPAFWQRDFAGTADVDSFVPVPAAFWLFSSGLIGLVSVARRKHSTSI